MMYLCNKYCTEDNQHLYPKSPEERGLVDRLLFFDMGTLSYAIKEYFVSEYYDEYIRNLYSSIYILINLNFFILILLILPLDLLRFILSLIHFIVN